MFAALKKMFGRGEAEVATTSTFPPPPIAPVRAAAPAPVQSPARVTPRTGELSPRGPAAPPAPPTPFAAAPHAGRVPVATAPANRSGDSAAAGFVAIPMSLIAGRIPPEVAQICLPMAAGESAIPLALVLPQLSRGSVKIPLSVIRAGAPEQAFKGSALANDVDIVLPLGEVVSRLDPSTLARRRPVKRWDAPAELGNLFGPKGETIKPAKAFFNDSQAPSLDPSQTSPASATATSGDTAFLYALSRASLEEKPIAMNAMAAIPGPAKSGSAPAAAAAQSPSPAPRATVQAAAPVAPVANAASAGEKVTISLAQVCERWPEPVRVEINKLRLAGSQIAIPASDMEPVLKTGRVAFTWRQVAGWLTPQAVAVGPEHAELKLEFPLSVVASLFLSRFKARDGKKVTVGADIPDVFGNATGAPARPQVNPAPAAVPVPEPVPVAEVRLPPQAPVPAAEVAAPAAPTPIPFSLAKSAPAPVAPVFAAPQPVVAPVVTTPVAPAQVSRLGALFGQPQKSNWEPAEIVQRLCNLPGVAGAVIALPEGLPVASQLPPHISADAFCGFLPQMFARINQYTRELKMGESTRLVIDVNGCAMMVFRTGRVYFGVLGQSGASLPAAQLSLVATELNNLNP